jgi:hypothetical protein
MVGTAGEIYTNSLQNASYIEALSDSSTHGNLQFVTGGDKDAPSLGTARMTITDDGNVGIGTGLPSAYLHVNNDTDLGTSVGDRQIYSVLSGDTSHNDQLETSLIRISSASGVTDEWQTAQWRIGRKVDSTFMSWIGFGGEEGSGTNNYGLSFGVGGSGSSAPLDVDEAMRIESDGKVGIGTSSPTKKLHIKEATGNLETKLEADALSDGQYARHLVSGMKSGGTDRHCETGIYYTDQSGSGGSNESCGYLRMDAGDGASNYIWFDNQDDLMMHTAVGSVGSTTGIEVADMASDERLKDIDSGTFPYGLDEINKLTPIKFKWKNAPNKGDKLGFGAQTSQSILPEVVKDTGICLDGYKWEYDENGGETEQVANSDNTKLSMSYYAIIPVLVKAVQELSAKVTALENA